MENGDNTYVYLIIAHVKINGSGLQAFVWKILCNYVHH